MVGPWSWQRETRFQHSTSINLIRLILISNFLQEQDMENSETIQFFMNSFFMNWNFVYLSFQLQSSIKVIIWKILKILLVH